MSKFGRTYGMTVSVAGFLLVALVLHSDGVIAWALVHMMLYELVYPSIHNVV